MISLNIEVNRKPQYKKGNKIFNIVANDYLVLPGPDPTNMKILEGMQNLRIQIHACIKTILWQINPSFLFDKHVLCCLILLQLHLDGYSRFKQVAGGF